MHKNIKNFIGLLSGFRKFSIMMIVIVTGIVFRVTEHVNGAEFVDLIKAATIAFFASNGIEHATNSIKEFLASKIDK